VLSVVRKQSRSTEAMLTNATVREIDGDTVVIAHTAAPLVRRLSEERNIDAIAKALRSVLGGQWRVRCVHVEQGATVATQEQKLKPVAAPVRPSRAAATEHRPPAAPETSRATGPAPQPVPAVDDIPPPPEPPEPDDPLPDDPMETTGPVEPARPDPDTVAVDLLVSHLGARKIDS
jgi:DNA polymerase-3 subunit gamma/tau